MSVPDKIDLTEAGSAVAETITPAAPVSASLPEMWVVSVLDAHAPGTTDPLASFQFVDEKAATAAAQRLLRAADRMRASGGVFRAVNVHLSKAKHVGTVDDDQAAFVLLREVLGLPEPADRADEQAVAAEKASVDEQPWLALRAKLDALASPSKLDFDALYKEALELIRKGGRGKPLPDAAHEFTAAMRAKGWQP